MVSAVKLGSGSYTYEMVSDWAKLPPGHGWREVAGVAVDSNDRVYVFSRGDHPMNVFDANGNFLTSWGEGLFTRAHGVTMAPDETLFCADDGDHTIRKCTLEGEVLFTLGTPGKAAAPHSGTPFNRCTDVAFDSKTGEFYVSDGYGNSSVHKYSPDGKLLFSWGQPGAGYGEFNIVHNIATDKDGYVYVADRENHRVQVFDSKGNFEAVWANLHRPAAITIADDQTVYVGELGTSLPVSADVPNIGPRVSVLNTNGEVLARVGDLGYGVGEGYFNAPHTVGLDSKGNIYVGEVTWTFMTGAGKDPEGVRSFCKLNRVG